MKRTGKKPGRWFWSIVMFLLALLPAQAQVAPTGKSAEPIGAAGKKKPSAPASPIVVQPIARDDDIRERIEKILEATGSYTNAKVMVKHGVVFLQGRAESDSLKEWAGQTAGKVEDVVAVFNGLEVAPPSPWDFSSTWTGLEDLWRGLLAALPFCLFGLLILVLAWMAALLAARLLRWSLRAQVKSSLLREVLARAGGFFLFLVGIYVILQVAGLARLALTVMGGTGLVGLVIGIAFRDITENFLSSIFLSLHSPFRTGDLVDIAGTLGYVQRVTSRNTVLMTLDGNIVQIPNATVYKNILRNYTSNPNRREDFVVGIDYETLVPHAQEVALKVLADHPALLKDPEPWVLVDGFGKASVNLRIYFWLDGSQHSWLKVKSSVMRLVKRAFQENGILIPDEAREILFPKGLEIRRSRPTAPAKKDCVAPPTVALPETGAVATDAEAGLDTEAPNLAAQARQSRPSEEPNLLDPKNHHE